MRQTRERNRKRPSTCSSDQSMSFSGGAGNDLLIGGNDNDKIIGHGGNDILIGDQVGSVAGQSIVFANLAALTAALDAFPAAAPATSTIAIKGITGSGNDFMVG